MCEPLEPMNLQGVWQRGNEGCRWNYSCSSVDLLIMRFSWIIWVAPKEAQESSVVEKGAGESEEPGLGRRL